MTVTRMYQMTGGPVIVTKKELAEMTGLSKRTIEDRLNEIRKESLPGGRYDGMLLTTKKDGGIVWINYLVWVDYEFHRERLQEPNLRKNVPAYSPYRLAWEMGYYADKEAVNT